METAALTKDVLLAPGSPLADPQERRRAPRASESGDDERTRERGPGGATQPGRAGSEATRVSYPTRLRGWGYTASQPTYAMTGAGLSSVAMAAERLSVLAPGLLAPHEREVLLALRDGAAGTIYQQRTRALTLQPGLSASGYDLLSLEKGMDAVGVEELGGRSWWWEEAKRLLPAQDPSGSWPQAGYDQGLGTAFVLLFLNRGTLSPFAREDRRGPVAAARPRTGSAPPRRPRTGDLAPASGPAPVASAAPAAAAPPEAPRVTVPPALAPGALVVASGAPAFPEQLLAAARTTRGREGDRVLDELRAAWAALPLADRVRAAPALHELGREAARDEAQSWARRALRELLEGSEAGRLEAVRLLLGELTRLEELAAIAGDDDLLTTVAVQADRERALVSLTTALDDPRLPGALRRTILTGLVRRNERAAIPWLLDELARRDPVERRVGWDLLVALMGEVHPFEPDGSSTRRAQALKEWRSWWEVEERNRE